jgi:hypothetical protein
MKQIRTICYPRSGHGVLAGVLKGYYENETKNKKVHFCDSVKCCGHKMPCKKSQELNLDLAYHKNHDFGSKVKNIVDPDIIYIIQYRKSVQEQINAYYRYTTDNKPDSKHFLRTDKYYTKKNRSAYIKHLNRNKGFGSYNTFINKWVWGNKNPNTYFLEYDDFVANPLLHISNIIKYIDGSVDIEKLTNIITLKNISKKFFIEKSNLYIENFNEEYKTKDVDFNPEDKFMN